MDLTEAYANFIIVTAHRIDPDHRGTAGPPSPARLPCPNLLIPVYQELSQVHPLHRAAEDQLEGSRSRTSPATLAPRAWMGQPGCAHHRPAWLAAHEPKVGDQRDLRGLLEDPRRHPEQRYPSS